MPIPVASDYGVKFGRDPSMGFEDQKAFPFIYSLVNYNDSDWTKNATPLDLSPIGPTIPASSTKTHIVVLDPDYNFKLIAIRYSVYKNYSGTYYWYSNMPQLTQDGDANMNYLGTPLLKYLSVTVSFQGSGCSVIQSGGPNAGAIGNSFLTGATTYSVIPPGQRVPLPFDVTQGYDYGYLTARRPHLLPRQGALVFDFTNFFDIDMVVAAAIYGLKVRV